MGILSTHGPLPLRTRLPGPQLRDIWYSRQDKRSCKNRHRLFIWLYVGVYGLLMLLSLLGVIFGDMTDDGGEDITLLHKILLVMFYPVCCGSPFFLAIGIVHICITVFSKTKLSLWSEAQIDDYLCQNPEWAFVVKMIGEWYEIIAQELGVRPPIMLSPDTPHNMVGYAHNAIAWNILLQKRSYQHVVLYPYAFKNLTALNVICALVHELRHVWQFQNNLGSYAEAQVENDADWFARDFLKRHDFHTTPEVGYEGIYWTS